jgi:phosphomannomutase
MEANLVERLIKAYDIRGLVGEELTTDFAFATGVAFARFLEIQREPATVVIGEDMRPSSPDLATAFADGINSQSFDVIRIGLASTDQLYFASGIWNLPGAMFTASHNPAEYNGIKLCRSGAKPIGRESGLDWIKRDILSGAPIGLRNVGVSRRRESLNDYSDFLISIFPDVAFTRSFQGRRLKIVIDAGNGMAGHTAPVVMKRINAELTEIFFELDGTFPNHDANPIEPKNLEDLQRTVLSVGADIGLAFDGDADRCFIVDEKGRAVSPSALTALIAERELRSNPGAAIIYNLICSRVVPETIAANKGIGVRSRVGHSFIKQLMSEKSAVFGGEHSGHFYFKKFWNADSGMLAALHAISALLDSNKSLSDLMSRFNTYVSSGEINEKVLDPKRSIERVKEEFLSTNPVIEVDELDGLTISNGDWWFNLRPSNTEPLLRLNVEAKESAQMSEVRDRVLGLIRKQ